MSGAELIGPAATPVQSDSIPFQDWGGLCAQLAIQAGSGSWFSESVAQHIKETDNTDRYWNLSPSITALLATELGQAA